MQPTEENLQSFIETGTRTQEVGQELTFCPNK